MICTLQMPNARDQHDYTFRCFATSHLRTKLAREYFRFFAVLSSSPHGAVYFSEFGLHDILNSKPSSFAGNHDLTTRLVLSQLLTAPENERHWDLLLSWFRNGPRPLQLYVLSLLMLLHPWMPMLKTVPILVDRLTQPDGEVAMTALKVLEAEVARNMQQLRETASDGKQYSCLEVLVSLKPDWEAIVVKAVAKESLFLRLSCISASGGQNMQHSSCIDPVCELEVSEAARSSSAAPQSGTGMLYMKLLHQVV